MGAGIQSSWGLKWLRGADHVAALQSEIENFIAENRDGLQVRFEPDTEPGYYLGEITAVPEPRREWGLFIGDAIHNFRSALDHLIWGMPRLGNVEPFPKAQFPIVSHPDAWKSTYNIQETVKQLDPDIVKELRKMQPYHAGNNARWMPLARLSAWDNDDKHRILHPVRFSLEDAFLSDEGDRLYEDAAFFQHVPMEIGNKIVRVKPVGGSKPQPETVGFAPEVALGDGIHVMYALGVTQEMVADIFRIFERWVGPP